MYLPTSENSVSVVNDDVRQSMQSSDANSSGSTGAFPLKGIFAALPDFGLAAMYLITWLHPYAFGQNMVAYLLLLMLMEFINVHSAGFMGFMLISDTSRTKKGLGIVGFGLFYTLFVLGFALGFGVWWPVWAFWIMTGNRLLGLLIGQAPQGREKSFVMVSWALSVLFYLAFVFVTSIAPVPAFGLTEEVIRAQGLTGGGLWIDEPQRVIAFGFLYFTAVAISEVLADVVMARSAKTNPAP